MENKIKELVDKLNKYTKSYDEGNPEISDKEWDDLYFELVKLEQQTGIYFEDSPTQRVNYQVVNELKKVEHSHPMLSLDKTKSIDELKNFIGNKNYVAMAKMDGLTCSLTYENGKLIKAETRGNGIIGEDVLHNALQIKNIPNKINYKDKLVVDGEVICDYKTFEKFSSEYKNPRNFASGSIRLLDSKESAMRGLSFIAWDVIEGLIDNKNSLFHKLFKLEKLGFTKVPLCSYRLNIEQAIKYIKAQCQDLGYPIDGIVIKYDNIKEYEAAGRTDHHFKGGIAYKFYDEEYETIVRDIEWTMGRTGVLTPVAIFDAIDIDGTEVSRASLHNVSVMEDLGVIVGSKVAVFKANQIIPQISKVIIDEPIVDIFTDGELAAGIPSICPICGGRTEIKNENGSKMLYCANEQCQGKLLNQLDHFCGKKGLDIKGISKATLDKLIDWGWVSNYKDIFELKNHRAQWIQKSGFGPASVDKILKSIEESKNTTLDKVIAAAGIGEIGSRVAKDLASHYDTWEDFRNETNFLQYNGIGEVMAYNLINFVYNYLKFEDTVKTYLNIKSNKKEDNDNSLEGKVFCITGKTHIFKNRTELIADIEAKGGRAVSSMSSKVDYLINNDNTSQTAKNKAALAQGTTILTEEEYLAL